jgi:hypothetical protein
MSYQQFCSEVKNILNCELCDPELRNYFIMGATPVDVLTIKQYYDFYPEEKIDIE